MLPAEILFDLSSPAEQFTTGLPKFVKWSAHDLHFSLQEIIRKNAKSSTLENLYELGLYFLFVTAVVADNYVFIWRFKSVFIHYYNGHAEKVMPPSWRLNNFPMPTVNNLIFVIVFVISKAFWAMYNWSQEYCPYLDFDVGLHGAFGIRMETEVSIF